VDCYDGKEVVFWRVCSDEKEGGWSYLYRIWCPGAMPMHMYCKDCKGIRQNRSVTLGEGLALAC